MRQGFNSPTSAGSPSREPPGFGMAGSHTSASMAKQMALMQQQFGSTYGNYHLDHKAEESMARERAKQQELLIQQQQYLMMQQQGLGLGGVGTSGSSQPGSQGSGAGNSGSNAARNNLAQLQQMQQFQQWQWAQMQSNPAGTGKSAPNSAASKMPSSLYSDLTSLRFGDPRFNSSYADPMSSMMDPSSTSTAQQSMMADLRGTAPLGAGAGFGANMGAIDPSNPHENSATLAAMMGNPNALGAGMGGFGGFPGMAGLGGFGANGLSSNPPSGNSGFGASSKKKSSKRDSSHHHFTANSEDLSSREEQERRRKQEKKEKKIRKQQQAAFAQAGAMQAMMPGMGGMSAGTI